MSKRLMGTVASCALLVMFLWLFVRPVAIQMYCHRIADEKARAEDSEGKLDMDRYDGYFKLCSNKWGL